MLVVINVPKLIRLIVIPIAIVILDNLDKVKVKARHA